MSESRHRRAILRPLVATLLAVGAVSLASSPVRAIGGLLPPVTTTTLPSTGDLVGPVTTLPVATLPPTALPPVTLVPPTVPPVPARPTTVVTTPATLPRDLKTDLEVDKSLDGVLGDGPAGGGGSLDDPVDGARVLGAPTPPAARLSSRHLLRVATASTRDFGFPLLLALLVGSFLLAQGWFDRRDPKLAAAPLSADDDLLAFR